MGHLKKFLCLALVLCGMLQVLIYFMGELLARKADFETECKAFTFHQSEWTLIMKDNTNDYTNCQNLTELLTGKIHFNG